MPRLQADLRRLGRHERQPTLAAGSASGPAEPDPRLPRSGIGSCATSGRAEPGPGLPLAGTGSCAGFTLIEVLVTITILALIAAMAWSGVDAIVRSKNGAEERLDSALRLSSVLDQWELDLANCHDAQVVPAIQFDGASLRLTRRTELGVQMVVWSLRGGVWRRWAAPAVTRSGELQEMWMRSQQLRGDEPGTIAALPGISQWQVYFWRNNAWTNPQSTGDVVTTPPVVGTPPAPGGGVTPGARQALPQGVRLMLVTAPGFGLGGSITRDIVLRTGAN